MIKIVIADDHKLIREGLRKLVENEIDIEVVGETQNPHEVVDLITVNNVDVLLLDLQFPEKSGLDILKDIKIHKPDQKVLILSMHPEERYAIRALKAGANGYISKDSDSSKIVDAIRKINDGRKYISSELSEQLLFNVFSDKPLHESLSDREFQILQMIAKGKTQTSIAEELSLGVSTVNTYRSRIIEKLQLSTTSDLIIYAIENNLID
jgi:DNA-binding NarL/FixJ family response regulator